MYKSLLLHLNQSDILQYNTPINKKIKYKSKKFIKLYLKKKPKLFKPIKLELKLFYNKVKSSLYGNNFHGQFNIKRNHNTLPHLENSYNKFIRYFIRNGLALKARATIGRAIYKFSKILVSKSQKHIKLLPLSSRNQLNFLYFSSFSKNANNLFNWWANANSHYFTFKFIKPTKMLKKRKKVKSKLICARLPFNSQVNYPLKFLNLYSEEINLRNIDNRVSQSLINTFINFKNNPIYLRRAKSHLVALRKLKF